ncbi:hypothetical protein ABGB07_14480 [Micromonosporaceae bacterium B7E4]
MTRLGRLADRMLSAFVPTATAAAATCWTEPECRLCSPLRSKMCWIEYCDGVYRSGFCEDCDTC